MVIVKINNKNSENSGKSVSDSDDSVVQEKLGFVAVGQIPPEVF